MHDYPLEHRTFGHMLADKASRVGDRPCLIFAGRRFTYAEAHRLSNRYANALAASGVRKGDHVATMMANCPEQLWTYWGLAKLGAVNVPLNTAARGDLLRYFLEQSDSRFVVVAREWSGRVAESVQCSLIVQACFTVGGHDQALLDVGLPIVPVEEFEQASDETPPADAVRFNDPQFIMYTSGTTGPSKGVVSPHAQGHAVGRHLAQQFGYGQDDVIYTCLPLFHGNALWYSCFAAFWGDSALALSPRYSASGFWDEIRETGATQFNALGAMTNILLKAEPSARERDHKVRQAMVIPLSRESYRAVSERFGVEITSLYAMTETFPVTMFVPGDPADKRSSAGKPRGLAEISIVDEDDQPLRAGETGEICVRPIEPWIMMLGYYKMPDATVRETRNMWLHTGDRGYVDEDGYLFFVDRKKEAIRRRGENISAYEVEMLAAKHPGVLEVAAVPVASELSEDEVMVFVVPAKTNAPSEEELVRFCNANMAHFMVPRFVHFIDSLPKTASEKIEKYKLKTWADENRASLWDREAHGIKLGRGRNKARRDIRRRKGGMVMRRAVTTLLGAALVLGAALSPGSAQEPIKIGFSGALSGGLSLLGQGVRDGIETSFAEINAAGGVGGRQLQLLVEDDAYEPMRSIAAARKLVEQDKVVALLAPTGTAQTAALIPFIQESNTPMLFPYGFSKALTNPTKRYVFATLPEVRVQMMLLAKYIVQDLKQSKITAIYQNDDFGQDAVAGLEERFGKDKVTFTKFPFDRGTTNFSGVVAQAKESGAEHVVFLGIPKDAALVLREMAKLGWKPQFSGHNALGDPQTFQLAGNLIEGALAVAVMEPLDSDKPAVKEFIAAQKKYLPRTQPTTYSMHGYLAGKLLAEALKRTNGKTDPESIVTALESVKDYDTGLMGPTTFSPEQHAGNLSGAFMKAENGRWRIITGWEKL